MLVLVTYDVPTSDAGGAKRLRRVRLLFSRSQAQAGLSPVLAQDPRPKT